MPKIIYIEPTGFHTPLLFDTFKETFEKEGYGETYNVREADIAFVDLYSWVKPIESKLGGVNIPLVFFDFTDLGGMSDEVFNYWWYEIAATKKEILVFVRKMSKLQQYPSYVHPIEHIIELGFPAVSKEELFNREYDICFIGNASPQRRNVVNGLTKAGFKMDVHWTNERGKIPHEEWLNRHRNAKMFLTADGGGFSDERIYQLGTIAAILKQSNNHLQEKPFRVEDGTCIEVFEDVPDFDAGYIRQALSNKNNLYDIYIRGINHLHKYYTAEWRAKYILSVLKSNGI